MTDTAAASLLPKVRTIAHEAGQVILRFYNDGIDAATKVDGSPVTQADLAAEHVITPALHHIAPGIPVVAEEAVAAGNRPDVSGGRFWLVDPLDGTKEFISRNGEFTVNIALIDGGRPVLGVVYAPATGDLYAACGPGTAVHWVEGRHDYPIQVRKPPPEGLTVVASRSHDSGSELDSFLAGYTVKNRITCGSSLKFCTVASGKADLYPRFGPTSEWDTAAGHAILTAAGGRVEQPDGSPFLYGKADILNPHFVAYGW
ncbi:3'(2'),5'-bisphosphate nucleotidase CysQ [Roseomonas genomospecies 6]|uniref:3'(2'),5'-bisphosphate nucleotidase CysQ n=1 Tax=Roseomonas genomospecies 6 TaxID=214106 RepID=A0A9W7NMY2_9PROT|nr:3'(2'),5'-bisphosphate nucleotidase CysQ [Roseomonas genomospecies 6]KAA0683329.1 3'(2'),5'-bisphosphate nucleotidase [Roseomonas genomospecies 6]